MVEKKKLIISALKEEADKLTDYAIGIRYPEEWSEPTLEEAKEALETARRVKEFVLNRATTFANE